MRRPTRSSSDAASEGSTAAATWKEKGKKIKAKAEEIEGGRPVL